MNAIREFRIHHFGGPEVLQADEVEPSLPDASQVLVAVKGASVNPVDFKIRSGSLFGVSASGDTDHTEDLVPSFESGCLRSAFHDHARDVAPERTGQSVFLDSRVLAMRAFSTPPRAMPFATIQHPHWPEYPKRLGCASSLSRRAAVPVLTFP
jgi:hypothetical protein